MFYRSLVLDRVTIGCEIVWRTTPPFFYNNNTHIFPKYAQMQKRRHEEADASFASYLPANRPVHGTAYIAFSNHLRHLHYRPLR